MKKNVIVLTFILILTIMLPSLASAGYEITQSNSSMHGTTLTKIYISKDKYKNANQYTQMIINFATDKIIVAIKNKKIYWQGTTTEYIKGMEIMQKSSLNRMKAALKKMPKEQRDKIMQIHGIGLTPKPVHVSVQKTKESEKIAGYKAAKYIVKDNNMPFEEVWIAKGVNITNEINLKKLQTFSGKMKKATAKPNPAPPVSRLRLFSPRKNWSKIKGKSSGAMPSPVSITST